MDSEKIKNFASIIQPWLQILTIVVAGLWGLYTYLAQQKAQADQANQTRLVEARKPFLEKQLALYFETATVTGILISRDEKSTEWKGARDRFWALYWSDLAMVESTDVETAMVEFGKVMIDSDMPLDVRKETLKRTALLVSLAIRNSIESGWSGQSLKDVDLCQHRKWDDVNQYLLIKHNCTKKIRVKKASEVND